MPLLWRVSSPDFCFRYFFNVYAPAWFGNDTVFYTAYLNSDGHYEIPFHVCMGLALFFTVFLMIGISLFGPKVNPKSFILDRSMFKLEPGTIALIVTTFLIISLLYIRFW